MTIPTAPAPSKGAALLTTLILTSAITLVVVSFVVLTRQEMEVTASFVHTTRAELGERAALEDAASLLAGWTENDEYIITAVREKNSAGTVRYTFLTLPEADTLTHVPLFAGGRIESAPMPDLNGASTSSLADRAVAAPVVSFEGGETVRAIQTYPLTHLYPDGTTAAEHRFPETAFIEFDPEETGPYRTRYSYWIEDMEGYPSPDVIGVRPIGTGSASGDRKTVFVRLGYSRFDSRTDNGKAFTLEQSPWIYFQFPEESRGQRFTGQIAPGLFPREISLAPWATGALSLRDHPFYEAALAAAHRHGSIDYPGECKNPARELRFVFGLKPYLRVPHLPYGHGYEDEGRPRHNLNRLIANRDMDLARIVERNLPQFEAGRKGGFPHSYVATLAANAIDYADEDRLPALPSNTSNHGTYQFRGVDAYTPVNELFVRWEYCGYEDDKDEWRVVFLATVFAEFWNPFNETAEIANARLKFRFVEPFGFKANSQVFEIQEQHLDRDEPFEGPVTLSIPPSSYLIHRFGDLRWKVPVRKIAGSPIAFPIVQDLRANLPNRADARAHYELWLGDELVDSSGRKGDANAVDFGFFFPRHQAVMAPKSHFMRLAPGNMAVLGYGFNAGNGSHLGDPWMTFYSRSTIENALYRFKGSPGGRNFDRDKVKPASRPDWYKDQARVRAWPDRGYDTPVQPGPSSDAVLPDDPGFVTDADPAYAPWRLSNLGFFHSVTELGNLHDPVMWAYGPGDGEGSVVRAQSTQRFDEHRDTWLRSLPSDATASGIWGGGNTLRIGRPEHELFDRAGMRASQLLDLFHTGFTGANLTANGGNDEALYRDYDPADHQPPPAAPTPRDAERAPWSLLYRPELNAQGDFALVHGHLNLNSVPTAFEIEAFLRGPSVSSDLRLTREDPHSPHYDKEGEGETLRSALAPEAIPLIAAGLLRARPFYSPSHFARVLSELIERHEALHDHHNDAEAEESFARIFNATTFSSRHFRVFTYAESYHAESGAVFSRSRRVHELFLRPEHDADGKVIRSRPEILSSRRF